MCRGDNGYIHIARHNHACGVTTDPMYAVFEAKHHHEESREEAGQIRISTALPVA